MLKSETKKLEIKVQRHWPEEHQKQKAEKQCKIDWLKILLKYWEYFHQYQRVVAYKLKPYDSKHQKQNYN